MKYIVLALAAVLSGVHVSQPSQSNTKNQIKQQEANYFDDLDTVQNAIVAMIEYITHHNGRFPKSQKWEESIRPYWPNGSYSVSMKEHIGNRLAMNRTLSGVKYNSIHDPAFTVVLYETQSTGKNANGLPPIWKEYAQCAFNEKKRSMMAFRDGWAYSFANRPAIGIIHKK